jgi:hypothetical protein
MTPDNYVVAVPSYKRANTIASHTLAMLAAGGVARERVHVYVANQEQLVEYVQAVPRELCATIRVSAPGLGPSRNAIQLTHPEGTPVLFVDDDVLSMWQWVDPKRLDPLTDVDGFVRQAFDLARSRCIGLWGVSAVRNPFYMKPTVSTDLKFCDGTLYGIVNTHDPLMFVDIENKEDIDRTCKYYARDGGVMRFNSIAFKSRPYWTNPGGLAAFGRTEAMNLRSAHELVRRYPRFCTLNPKPNRMEIRLRDKRPK